MKKYILCIVLLFYIIPLNAQINDGVFLMDEFRNPKKRRLIQVPDFNGYKTLKCDFHMHTIFSDGFVWPTIRIQEAWQEGLDVIAITDHVEYTPHSKDVRVNHNRSWELASKMAEENNIILIKGVEISRQTPPGHFNAIFVGDALDYITERSTNERDKEALMKASEQNAFIFWNHPGWRVNRIEGSYEWIDFVDKLYNERILHGIEVFNGFKYHLKALDWCIDNDLTVLGSSDIHNLVKHEYSNENHVHRTMTLVFAEERTKESVRKALEDGRTVAWSSKYIAGKEELVRNLFNACIELKPINYSKNLKNRDGTVTIVDYFEITNKSDLYFEIIKKNGDENDEIILFPQSSQIFSANNQLEFIEFEVVTTFIRSNKHLNVKIPLK